MTVSARRRSPSVPANAFRTGHAFLDDIAHTPCRAPGLVRRRHTPDRADCRRSTGRTDDGDSGAYDNEMLDAHFITGDGRGNENIGLTAVHPVFHSEHNHLVEAQQGTLIASRDRRRPRAS